MCIRDRAWALIIGGIIILIFEFYQKEKIATEKESDLENISCLLYTSDAADERSSVDLGGRRIIKKKN